MGQYIPYITLSKKEPLKLDAILSYKINVHGLMIDLRRFYGKDLSSTRELIAKILHNNPNAIIIADPRADAFQADSSIRLKIKSLRNIYSLAGYSTQDLLEDNKFSPAYIDSVLDKFIKNMIAKLQWHKIQGSGVKLPYILSPYFVTFNYNDGWYQLTRKAIEITKKTIEDDTKILAPVAIHKKILENEINVRKIINDYASMDVYGYVILPFNLDETSDTETKLRNLTLLATGLKKTGKFVVVHTAEFGNVLVSLGIDAITCGICTRKTPYMFRVFDDGLAEIARAEVHLYIHKIFKKLHPTKFYKFTQLIPNAYSCDCPICSEYTGSYYDMLEEAGYTDFSVHYIYWKNKEMQQYSGKPDELLKDLSQCRMLLKAYNEAVKDEVFFIEDNKYLYQIHENYVDRWISVLRTFSQSDSTRT